MRDRLGLNGSTGAGVSWLGGKGLPKGVSAREGGSGWGRCFPASGSRRSIVSARENAVPNKRTAPKIAEPLQRVPA